MFMYVFKTLIPLFCCVISSNHPIEFIETSVAKVRIDNFESKAQITITGQPLYMNVQYNSEKPPIFINPILPLPRFPESRLTLVSTAVIISESLTEEESRSLEQAARNGWKIQFEHSESKITIVFVYQVL